MTKTKYTAKQFIEAIKGSGGIISTIASRVGCHWITAKKYIEDSPSVQAAYKDELEKVNDMAVGILIKSIQDGDIASAKWWLARKRREEFGESVEIQSENSLRMEDLSTVFDLIQAAKGSAE